VGGAERGRGCQKGILVGSARPVALKRGLQLAVRTDARSAQYCDSQCSVRKSGDRKSGDRHGLTPSVGGKGHGDATAQCPRAEKPQDRKRTTGTPRPRTFDVSRQVSWLAGRCLGQAFPGERPVALYDVGSPLTVAGAAPALSRSHDQPAPASLLASEGRILRR